MTCTVLASAIVLLASGMITGITAEAGTNWAVLVAGSNQYGNYRHQADICHAYHLLADKGGFPKENIVTMMYDDIAYNTANPVQGNIINQPNGTNLYPGVLIDYKGEEVTAANFLSALSGDGSANGKAIKSGPQDRIFVYYADHGAAGLVCFPSAEGACTGKSLYADQLLSTIKQMRSAQKFKEMVLYIEACESGSMCEGLTAEEGVYCMTASTPDQSSYAYYWSDSRQAYLGDEWSIHWLEDSDAYDEATTTIATEYKAVSQQTTDSQAQEYGNLTIGKDDLNSFQAFQKAKQSALAISKRPQPSGESFDQRDVTLRTFEKRAELQKTKLHQQFWKWMVMKEQKFRTSVDVVFADIQKQLNPPARTSGPQNFNCLRAFMGSVHESCGELRDYGRKYVKTLVAVCESRTLEEGITAVQKACEARSGFSDFDRSMLPPNAPSLEDLMV